MQASGAYGVIGAQYEETYGSDPAVPDLTKIYIETEGLKSSQNQIQSKVMMGNRMTGEPSGGNINATGPITTEFGAYIGILLAAAAGSVKTEGNSGTGEVLGAALTTPTAVIDAFNQTLTITSTSHGVAVGESVKIEGITAPTGLNDTYVRCMKVTSANIFVCRIPLGISGTFTLGAGTVKKVTTAATTYKHTIAFGGRLPSLLIEKGFTDISQYLKYNGCVCGKMDLTANNEGFQTVSFDFPGQKETTGSSSFDSTMTDLGKTSFSAFQGTIEEGGSAIAYVMNSPKLSVDNALDTDKYPWGGGGLRSSIPEGRVKVNGSIEAMFQDMTLYNKAVNNTTSSLKLIYTKGTGAGTAGNEYLDIYLPLLKYSRDAPTIGGEGGVLVNLPFEAFWESGQTSICIMTLKNAQLAI